MGSYLYKNISTSLVRKCFARMLHNAGKPSVFHIEHIYPLTNDHSLYGELLRAHGLQLSARGNLARTGHGFFKKDDFVLWHAMHAKDLAQPWGAGVLKEVVLARRAGDAESMYAVVDTYALVDDRSSPASWVYDRAKRFDVVSMSLLMWRPVFHGDDGRVHIAVPLDAKTLL